MDHGLFYFHNKMCINTWGLDPEDSKLTVFLMLHSNEFLGLYTAAWVAVVNYSFNSLLTSQLDWIQWPDIYAPYNMEIKFSYLTLVNKRIIILYHYPSSIC